MLPPFFRRRLLSDPKKLGRWGERQSEKYLARRGFSMIARNFRCKIGEIDLIMSDDSGAIVFIEVKTRRSESLANAQDAVNFPKRQKLVNSAKYFVKQYDIKGRPLRFDVMAVVLGEKGPVEIRHYRNAFVP